jgi:thiamine-phosphate pyrophosphorylase
MTVRLFLVAPEALDDSALLTCTKAACTAADCASILVPATVTQATVKTLQDLGLAVILNDAEPRKVHHLKADGLQLSSLEHFKEARAALSNESLGLMAKVSRHDAMEASEGGADFISFTQTKQYQGEPIIKWWQDVTEVPAVAFDPVSIEAVATVKPQNPDFIRPMDEMWQDADTAARVVTTLMSKWSV